ncbi:M20 aminoacylase family protein [Diaphorobacter ruginosibacter]|uniref:M20 aminoacylase family protein n=1 Tax=Diaphorobacter ruginosibacter TaxID=1715720 RepID=UPI00333E420A
MQVARIRAGGRAFAHISTFHPELTSFRRDLHAHPELGFEEKFTSARVAEALRQCGVDEVHEHIGKTGMVALIHGQTRSSGSMIGLRADMDALPMQESNEFTWKSARQGLMHGCGHDGHITMLVGAARYLAATRQFDGTAVLIFQPAEEGLGGARVMIEDGLFDRFPVQSIFAMHNWPQMKPGTVGLNGGAMMAAADRITIDITGRGGHGAHPYQTVDVVLVAGHIITALQGIVSRNVRALDSAVVSLCAVQAGDLGAFSVLPGTATLVGTVRSFDPAVQEMVERRIQEVCSGVAMGMGASVNVRYERIYPATINTESEARFAGDVAASIVGAENVVRDLEPSMGAEDFSFMLQSRPGAYLRIGQGMGANNSPLHNNRYDFNDDILPLGAALHAGLIEQGMPLAAA